MLSLKRRTGVSLRTHKPIETDFDEVIDDTADRKLVGYARREPGACLVLRKSVAPAMLKQALRLLDERDGHPYPDRQVIHVPQ